ncbi:patatin-like phospholipase family protein [Dyella sp. C9]|uniref:patatin-like phospholipase family protein n=1 Tax=Dyella sp. C9 TaxID=2202154 RepID=UPI000DEFBE66|nr:patatin-like phospholipase family protein [Dyella sp. C9]
MTTHEHWKPEDVLQPDELKAFRARRAKAAVANDEPAIGLALSGGGIRSATFCLGLLRALAKNKVLHRVDYLSTVSGGGYIGASLGRLYNGTTGTPSRVEAGLADDNSLLLWWLRSNGRYLTPAGWADMLVAIAGQLRSFVVTQFEVLILALMLGCLITLPHMLAGLLIVPGSGATLLASPWWILAILLAAFALTAAYAYWFLGQQHGAGLSTALLAAVVGIYCAYVSRPLADALRLAPGSPLAVDVQSPIAPLVCSVALVLAVAFLLAPAGWAWAKIADATRGEERSRLQLTRLLGQCLKLGMAVVMLSAIDTFSWYIAYVANSVLSGQIALHLGTSAGLIALLVAAARIALPAIQKTSTAKKLPLTKIANAIGLLLVFFIALLWTSLVQLFVLSRDANFAGLHLGTAWQRWFGLFGVCLGYVLCNGFSLQQLNRSSLHFFYRSRLARAYVSVGNDGAGSQSASKPRFPTSVLGERTRINTTETEEVTELLDGDDVNFVAYSPHSHGGPIHLINCCINQTIDDRIGAYNADRKGISLTVSSLGVETGTQLPSTTAAPTWARATLAQWVAISGAAVGTGMGSNTLPGMATLIFLSGLRLGYWQPSLTAPPPNRSRPYDKFEAIRQEMFAQFPGLRDRRWYLSDGGHFDNTGVYALLKRKLPIIILADCGADPGYLFADVENLIRKARIDHNAAIRFIDPASLSPLDGALGASFGTPDSIQPGASNEYLLLAQITYDDGTIGALLIVKPRCTTSLPLDVAGYADRFPGFPQQSTTNQFFSEEEWESYSHLGSALGEAINMTTLNWAHQWVRVGATIGTNAETLSQSDTAPKLTRAQRIAATIGTSIGLGAVLTGLLAGWQVWDGHPGKDTTQLSTFATEAHGVLQALQSHSPEVHAFDTALDARIKLLTSMARNFAIDDDQAQAMRDIAFLLQDQCTDSLTNDLRKLCDDDAIVLNNGAQSNWYWDDAMNTYRAFATAVTQPPPATVASTEKNMAPAPGEAAGTPADTTAAALPSAPMEAPSPPPPPPPPEGVASAPPATVIAPIPTQRSATLRCGGNAAESFVLYAHIYSEAQRPMVAELLSRVRQVGIATPGIENVTETAKSDNRFGPARWAHPAILYHSASQGCAEALADFLRADGKLPDLRTFALPESMGGASNVLQLWIPSAAGVAQASP